MPVKKKINIFEKCMIFLWFWLIYVEIFHDFGWLFVTRIRFMKRIRLAKMKRIQTDPDSKHWKNMKLWFNLKRRWLKDTAVSFGTAIY